MDSNYEVDSEKGSELGASEDETKILLSKYKNRKNKKYIFWGMLIYIIFITIPLCVIVKHSLKYGEEAKVTGDIFAQAEKMEEKYGINIMWGGRCDEQRVRVLSGEADLTYVDEKIRFALGEIETIMSRLPKGFFDEYKKESVPGDGRDYIDIYLCESIVHENDIVDSVQYGVTSAYLTVNGEYICIDVNPKKDFKFNFAHELFHVIESKICVVSLYNNFVNNGDISEYMFANWEKINPDDYCYLHFENNHGDLHVFDVDLPYDIDTEDIDNVYFVSRYAQYSDNEDRAETFTYLIACDDADDLPESYNSPHVKEKAKLIVDMIDDTFDCVDDNAYWARMYHEKYGD